MREHFHVPDNYFLSHSVGCLPKSSPGALQDRFLGPWMSGENWTKWMGELEMFREGLAHLLGVNAAMICPQTNISSGLTKILYSLPKRDERDLIVLSKMDFPTIGFVAAQAERAGYSLQFIEGDPSKFQPWDEALSERVAFVLATHALSNTSHILPIAEICARARAVGAISIVDIAQSMGAVPVDIPNWNPDFVIGTGVKFLCAGPGACFLYASQNILPECQPIDVGWFSHENPFEMEIEHFRYATDAMRFFGGTPSPAAYVCANSALKLWEEIGLRTAQTRIQNHLTSLHETLPHGAAISPIEPNKRGATLVLDSRLGNQIQSDLIAAGVKFDHRKQGFRFSVHGYTREAEIKTLADVFAQLQG